jgi:uracil-DNA glycosylase family 4
VKWVMGEGPLSPLLMMIGESPAIEEEKQGRPFVGKTGKEVDNLIHRFLKIPRSSIYITNVFKYSLNEDKEYEEGEWELAVHELEKEIKKVRPSIILAMGAIACRALGLPRHDMDALNANVHEWNGIRVVPSFHPAASFHSPAILQYVIEAFKETREQMQRTHTNIEYYDENPPSTPYIKEVGIERVEETYEGLIGLDTETLGEVDDPFPYMIQIASREDEAHYVYADDKKGVEKIKRVIEKSTCLIHNSLFDLKVLKLSGIRPTSFVDTMVEAFLHQTLPLGLKELAYRLLKWEMKEYGEVVGEFPSLEFVEEEERVQYALADPCACLAVHRKMGEIKPWVDNTVLARDMGIVPMLVSMMERGFKVDKRVLSALEAELSVRNFELLNSMIKRWPIVQEVAKTKTTKKLGTVRIEDFNPGSDKQLSTLLYSKLDLGSLFKVKKSKWGGSVNKNSLVKMENKHPIVPLIQEWRETQTLVDDFLSTLPSHVKEDGRIHTSISMVRVKHSGRLASSSPNLMNQPTRTSDGQRIREAFVPDKGYSLWSFDYNQIEMRLMAHLSQDPVMCEAYRNGKDIHTETAMRMFKIKDASNVDEMKHRYPAKRTGFGIINDISAQGLSRELLSGGAGVWSEGECEILLSSWFNVYRGVKEFMMKVRSEARLTGRVSDMWGRMEYIPGVYSCFEQQKEKGLRVAINQKIQSGAQGIIKEAMRQFHTRGYLKAWEEEGWAYPLIQIHDDLLWEIREDVEKEVAPVIKLIMEKAVKISVPVSVGVKKSKENWGKLEKEAR